MARSTRRPIEDGATTSPETVTPLIEILDAQVRELRTLLAIAEEQERALVHGDAGSLTDTLGRHVTTVRTIAELEAERRVRVERMEHAIGVPAGRLTLSRLLTLFPALAPRLGALRGELSDLLARIGTINARNAYLIGKARDLLDGLARRLVTALGPEPAFVYVESGRPAPGTSAPRLVDRRA